MVSACRTPETMIPKLMVTCSILFVMSCFVLSFAWYTNSSNTACLGPAAHLAWQTFAQRVRDHWDFHNVTDPATREGWIQRHQLYKEMQQNEVELLSKRDRFEAASTSSNYVLAFAIIYAFTIMLTSLYAFLSLCCCPNNWYISTCIRNQYPAHLLSGVLCLGLIVSSCVHAGLSEGLWSFVVELTGKSVCKEVVWSEQRNWCPAVIFFAIVVLMLHVHVALVTYIFKRDTEALAKKIPGSSSNSSSNLERGRSSTNSSGVQQQSKDSLDKPGIGGASIESSKGRGFTNILTFKSNNDNEAGRSRIPSSRNYPSSPILPINSATNEEHNNPLTKNC